MIPYSSLLLLGSEEPSWLQVTKYLTHIFFISLLKIVTETYSRLHIFKISLLKTRDRNMNYIEPNFKLSWSQNEWELKRKSKRKNLDVTQETVYYLQKNKNILPLFYFNAPLIQLFMFLEFFQPLPPTSLFHTPCIWNPRAVCFIDQ